jgi:hypothetical protein
MNLPFVDVEGTRIQAAKAFAGQFSEFEWQYLCSYQWFLTAVDQGLATGDFFPVNIRAERTLVDERIRPRWKASKDFCHSNSSFI